MEGSPCRQAPVPAGRHGVPLCGKKRSMNSTPRKPPARESTGGRKPARTAARPSSSAGWRSTDEEEIARRRARAAAEPLEIEPAGLPGEPPVFATFHAGSGGSLSYEVEIRSLSERSNSCSCPDHQVNTLGTCKHVEAVLLWLKASPRRLARAARDGNPRAEVFLRRTGEQPEVRIEWPAGVSKRSTLYRRLQPFFTADGALLGDPATALPALARTVEELPAEARAQVRLSRQLPPWVEDQRRRAARGAARAGFLAEVAAGRASLDVVKLPLFPYQQEGMLHLAFTERALLADEMGLGKTVQAVAACELLRRLRGITRVLVVSPASLKAEWQEQIARFTDLPSTFIQGPRAARLRQYRDAGGRRTDGFFYLAHYEQILHDAADVQNLLAPDVVILDEAQRIKNWQAKTAQAVKRLRSPYAFVLTGTPIENRIDEIYSIVQFLDPALFGPLFRFNRDFYELDERGRPCGHRNLGELQRRLAPVLLRRRKDAVEDQLPDRTVSHHRVGMDPEQHERYHEYNARVSRLLALAERRPLTPEELDQMQRWLACMRMLCDTPYILDADCRVCPKLPELREILENALSGEGTKVLVFSEWERMLELVREMVQEMGVGFAWHTGSVPQPARRQEIRRFKDDPECRLFLSTDSGGVGLNLQAANVVVNLDLPWNPARLEQRIARAWRKHQTRPVHVVNLVTEDSIEQRMIPLLERKQALADGVLDGRGDLAEQPLASGRAAFLEKVAAVLGTPAPPPDPAPPLARFRDEAMARWDERLLLLEARTPPAAGRETVLAVLDRTEGGEREQAEALLRERLGEAAEPPAVELIDRATYAAIERLIAAGVLQFTSPNAAALHRSPLLDRRTDVEGPDARAAEEARQRARRAREAFGQAERKVRMAAALAGGGFPVEGLPLLREGIERTVEALAGLAGQEEGTRSDVTSLAEHLPRHGLEGGCARALVDLASQLRRGPEALLAVDETEARAWIGDGQILARQVGGWLQAAAEGTLEARG